MNQVQEIRLFRDRSTMTTSKLSTLLSSAFGSETYQAEFSPPVESKPLLTLARDDERRSTRLDRLESADKVDLVIKSVMLLNSKDVGELHIKVEESYWNPRVVQTEDGKPYQANEIKFLFDLYGKANGIPVTYEGIERKIKKAYCPEGVVEENPILEYCKYILFEKFDALSIDRPAKFGGNLEILSYEELEKIFGSKELHPMDLKNAVAHYLNKLIQPVREKLENNPEARKLAEEIKSFDVTR